MERIDRDSSQLAAAPTVSRHGSSSPRCRSSPSSSTRLGSLARRYAVIIDEAHSQTGRQPRSCRVLGVAAREDDDLAPDAEDALADVVAARGRQPNLSFGIFTATPKGDAPALATPTWIPASTSRPTCTRCVRPSRRASSTMCWPTTPPMRPSGASRRRSPRIRPSRRPRPAAPSHGS